MWRIFNSPAEHYNLLLAIYGGMAGSVFTSLIDTSSSQATTTPHIYFKILCNK